MIALLSYSTSWSKSNGDSIMSSTGEVELSYKDSVLISYDDLRIVNSKLIELKYEKQLNNNLRAIISTDSITINSFSVRYNNLVQDYERDTKRSKKEKNILIGTNIGTIILLILSLLK